MDVEYEATFTNVDKDKIRSKLIEAGARLVRKEFMLKRIAFRLPKGHEIEGGWMRVRDEGEKITMSLKVVGGKRITDQKEVELTIDSLESGVMLLENLGCEKKAYQESRREMWDLDGVQITIDEWPFLEPFVEVEGKSENAVKKASEKLGFEYKDARFCAVDELYSEKYGVSMDQINNNTPEITFKKNPFKN